MPQLLYEAFPQSPWPLKAWLRKSGSQNSINEVGAKKEFLAC